MIDFATHPGAYRHWKLAIEGPVARLTMAVQEDGGLVPGYASLIGVALILGGVQLSFIGLIGQYLARVFEEVKGRPAYLIKQHPDDVASCREAPFVVEPHAAMKSRAGG